MFKLAAAIRNHFVSVPYIEAKAPCSKSPRQTLVPIVQGGGNPSRSPSAVVSKLVAALRTSLHPKKIEAMNTSVGEAHLPSSIPSSLPNSSLASLARMAPAVCSQIRSMNR